MRSLSYIAGIAVLVASVSNSWAGAVLQSGTDVQSLQGPKSVELAAGAKIVSGTRIINRADKAEAKLAFPDGCSIDLVPGQVFTVGEVSPCAYRAQEEAAGGLSAPLIIGGVVVAGAIVGGVVAATSGKSGGQQAYLPLSF